jgi:hypothetical protein
MNLPGFLGPPRSLFGHGAPAAAESPPVGGNASSRGAALDFVIHQQQQANWCWAAVTASVAAFFGIAPAPRQCDIAQEALAPTSPGILCCGADAATSCNRPWHLDGPLQAIGAYRQRETGSLAYGAVAGEIAAGLPPACRVAWQGGGAHFMVLSGWSEDTANGMRYVKLQDPGNGSETDVPYEDLVAGYTAPGDRWTHSYLTADPAPGGTPMAGGFAAEGPVSA